jgi:hypothetical protein
VESATAGRCPSNPESHEASGKKINVKTGGFMVKKTINALVCVLIAPLAFAQTRPTNTGQKTTNQPPTAKTETASGTVTTTY